VAHVAFGICFDQLDLDGITAEFRFERLRGALGNDLAV
jgi:hypothetical protein